MKSLNSPVSALSMVVAGHHVTRRHRNEVENGRNDDRIDHKLRQMFGKVRSDNQPV